jgi:hypothetical protein
MLVFGIEERTILMHKKFVRHDPLFFHIEQVPPNVDLKLSLSKLNLSQDTIIAIFAVAIILFLLGFALDSRNDLEYQKQTQKFYQK